MSAEGDVHESDNDVVALQDGTGYDRATTPVGEMQVGAVSDSSRVLEAGVSEGILLLVSSREDAYEIVVEGKEDVRPMAV